MAEQWGRRWITIDTSRVPLALARQRLLTATFPFYELNDEQRGPVGGFVYLRSEQSRNPKSIGPGIVSHITSTTIANDERPTEEVLVDRPEVKSGVTRVTGPFWFEATIPTPIDWEGDGIEDSGVAETTVRSLNGCWKFCDEVRCCDSKGTERSPSKACVPQRRRCHFQPKLWLRMAMRNQ